MNAGVVELTGLLRASATAATSCANWPADMRIICRRERPSAGAQLCALEEADGWRYQLFATNTGRGQLGRSSRPATARHARVEDRIRCGKATGLDHLPSTSMAINQAWCVAATIAADLLCWLRLLCLDRPLADAEPKTLRYRMLHTAARIVRGQRKRKIKIPETWPWAARARRRVPRRVRPDPHRPDHQHRPPSPTRATPPARGTGATRRDRRSTRPRPSTQTKITNGGEDHQRRAETGTYPPSE